MAGANVNPESYRQGELRKWRSAMVAVGIPAAVVPFCLAQLVNESAWFTSASYKQDLNAGGIKYAGKPGTVPGRKAGYNEGNYYARYLSYGAFAADYKRVISQQLYGQRLGPPINATTPESFVDRLKANRYFTSSAAVYKRNVVSILKRITGGMQDLGLGPLGLVSLALIAFIVVSK